jgi:hypothetical protein
MMAPEPEGHELEEWRQAYRAVQAAGSPQCPTDARLRALIRDALPAAERTPLADHIVQCRQCTDRYQTWIRIAMIQLMVRRLAARV